MDSEFVVLGAPAWARSHGAAAVAVAGRRRRAPACDGGEGTAAEAMAPLRVLLVLDGNVRAALIHARACRPAARGHRAASCIGSSCRRGAALFAGVSLIEGLPGARVSMMMASEVVRGRPIQVWIECDVAGLRLARAGEKAGARPSTHGTRARASTRDEHSHKNRPSPSRPAPLCDRSHTISSPTTQAAHDAVAPLFRSALR